MKYRAPSLRCCVGILVIMAIDCSSMALRPLRILKNHVRVGYSRRVAADSSFPMKSTLEVLLAAGTQLTAELERRRSQFLVEGDFVIAGLITAVAGKYFSMWKVAPTRSPMMSITATQSQQAQEKLEQSLFGVTVPTNAFQRTMLDGHTVPTLQQRGYSFLLPALPLFFAGCTSSLVGYGLTTLMILLRSIVVPSFVQKTQNVNIIYASIFTGAFMATISNIRYQILQGLVEPTINAVLKRWIPQLLVAFVVVIVRVANGLLGSVLVISGMRLLGLQRLR